MRTVLAMFSAGARLIGRGALVVAALVLACAGPAYALGGGGSGGFGGGGGGFSGGGGGGGGGFSGGDDGSGGGSFFSVSGVVFMIFWCAVAWWMFRGEDWQEGRRREGRQPITPARVLSLLRLGLLWPLVIGLEVLRRRHRVRRVRLASVEAAEADPLFAHGVVVSSAQALFRDVQAAWSADDRGRLSELVSGPLMAEWERRLRDFAAHGWRNTVDIRGRVRADYVGLLNRATESERYVCVRIACRVRDVVYDREGRRVRRRHSFLAVHHVVEYWTLGRGGGRWVVAQVEQHREGLHQLREPVVASPELEEEPLRAAATAEVAQAARAADADLAGIITPTLTEDARRAALDLSLVDGRFAPEVISNEVHCLVRAWLGAVDGGPHELARLASPDAVTALRYGDDRSALTRAVVRGLRVSAVDIVGVAGGEAGASVTVVVHARAVSYREDRSTLIVTRGSRDDDVDLDQQWQLELSDDPVHPWRLVTAAPSAPSRTAAFGSR